MINVRHTRYAIFVWEDEKCRGIVYPANVLTNIELFTYEVKKLALEQMRNIRFVSLVFDPAFERNYLPMREFLNSKEPICKNFNKGEEKEMYDFLQYDDTSARELYTFFFEHSTRTESMYGYIEYNFKID